MKKTDKASRKSISRQGSGRRPNAQQENPSDQEIGAFRARHLDLSTRDLMTETGISRVTVNDSESPLGWLASRKGRDGRALIGQDQFIAGERLRADFTRGHLAPRVTSSWSGTGRTRGAGGGAGEMTDLIVASRQRVRLALEACGPEFAGLLMDVCCFLHGLEDAERSRGWPPRSGKVVLQLALSRLARHYGVSAQTQGDSNVRIRTWLAGDAEFTT